MSETSERRREARLTIPSHLRDFEAELRLARLLDLTSDGARIEHPGHLHEGLICFLDLPPALGRIRLTCKVVWTRLHKGEQTFEGDKHVFYQSGLVFVELTPKQREALAAALKILRRGE